MSYTTTERMTDSDRMLASEGWVRIGLLEAKMLDEKNNTSPLAALAGANILYYVHEDPDPELQAEGTPIVQSVYVRTHQRENAQEIMYAFRHTHTV